MDDKHPTSNNHPLILSVLEGGGVGGLPGGRLLELFLPLLAVSPESVKETIKQSMLQMDERATPVKLPTPPTLLNEIAGGV